MISCYICHEPHHIAKDCPFRGDGRDDKHDGCYICGEMGTSTGSPQRARAPC